MRKLFISELFTTDKENIESIYIERSALLERYKVMASVRPIEKNLRYHEVLCVRYSESLAREKLKEYSEQLKGEN